MSQKTEQLERAIRVAIAIRDGDVSLYSDATGEQRMTERIRLALVEVANANRTEGIKVGLEMADRFVAVAGDRKNIASMIKAAILALKPTA